MLCFPVFSVSFRPLSGAVDRPHPVLLVNVHLGIQKTNEYFLYYFFCVYVEKSRSVPESEGSEAQPNVSEPQSQECLQLVDRMSYDYCVNVLFIHVILLER